MKVVVNGCIDCIMKYKYWIWCIKNIKYKVESLKEVDDEVIK